MEAKKKMPIWARVILIVLAALISIVVLVLIGAHFITPIRYFDFFIDSAAEYKTPGMMDGAVLQGYAYDEATNTFLHTAYMKDKSASRIYVVDGENNKNVKSRYQSTYCLYRYSNRAVLHNRQTLLRKNM